MGAWRRKTISPDPGSNSSDRETGELSIRDYYAAARQDALVDLHYKEVAGALAKWLEGSTIRRVVLCAQHDIAGAFRRALAPAVASKVVARSRSTAAITTSQMLVNARNAATEARHGEFVSLLGRIKEGLGSGGHGAPGSKRCGTGWSAVRSRPWWSTGTIGRRVGRARVVTGPASTPFTRARCAAARLCRSPTPWRAGPSGDPAEQPGGSGRGHPGPRRDGRDSGVAAVRLLEPEGSAARRTARLIG